MLQKTISLPLVKFRTLKVGEYFVPISEGKNPKYPGAEYNKNELLRKVEPLPFYNDGVRWNAMDTSGTLWSIDDDYMVIRLY